MCKVCGDENCIGYVYVSSAWRDMLRFANKAGVAIDDTFIDLVDELLSETEHNGCFARHGLDANALRAKELTERAQNLLAGFIDYYEYGDELTKPEVRSKCPPAVLDALKGVVDR